MAFRFEVKSLRDATWIVADEYRPCSGERHLTERAYRAAVLRQRPILAKREVRVVRCAAPPMKRLDIRVLDGVFA